jgi:hypothetical protein
MLANKSQIGEVLRLTGCYTTNLMNPGMVKDIGPSSLRVCEEFRIPLTVQEHSRCQQAVSLRV